MSVSVQKLFYAIAVVFGLFAILILAKPVLIPLAFALLFAFILYPLTKKLEHWGVGKLPAAFISLFVFILIIGGSLFFFSAQLIRISDDFSDFGQKISRLFADLIFYLNDHFAFSRELNKDDLWNSINKWLGDSAAYLIGSTFSSTTTFLAQLVATIVYTFLLLVDRGGLTQAVMKFSSEEKQTQMLKMLRNVQKIGQKYLSGVLIIILILGVVNSAGLWIIGIDHPFLFGFLAASLTIIPYVGTTFGASIPVLYAFMSHDSLWVPFAVFILFWSVQLIESNFLSPKIVGGSVNVNALAAILSLIIGAMVWGVAGMILFLPFTAVLKVVCQEYVQLRPIAMLIETRDHKKHSYGFALIKNSFVRIKNLFKSKSR